MTPRTIAVTSGKGGVGKTVLSVNLSLELAAMNQRVLLLDGDFALSNTDVMFGLSPAHHLGDVLSGKRSVREIIVDVTPRLRLIPSGSGVLGFGAMTETQHKHLVDELSAVERESEFCLIDTASGLSGNVIGVLLASSEVIIVTTPDPTAILDAYTTIKVIHRAYPGKPIWVVLNEVRNSEDGDAVFAKLSSASAQFLAHPVRYLGAIPHDASMSAAVRKRMPVSSNSPESTSARAIRRIARELCAERPVSGDRDTGNAMVWDSLFRAST